MRETSQAWWCGMCHSRNEASKMACQCGNKRVERHAQVHTQDRAVVYYNPITGEHRTPPTNHEALPTVYANQGFERREIMNMTGWEKESGVVHEQSNFNPGNEQKAMTPDSKKAPKELVERLVNDMREAVASGPWTGQDRLL